MIKKKFKRGFHPIVYREKKGEAHTLQNVTLEEPPFLHDTQKLRLLLCHAKKKPKRGLF